MAFWADSPSKEKVTGAVNAVKLSQALGQLLPDEHTKFISSDFVQVSPTCFTSQGIEESPINSLIVLLGRCLLSVTLQRWQGKPLPDVLQVPSFLLLVFVKTDLISCVGFCPIHLPWHEFIMLFSPIPFITSLEMNAERKHN